MPLPLHRLCRTFFVAALATLAASSSASAQRLVISPAFPGHERYYPTNLSSDGRVVVGQAEQNGVPYPNEQVFRWDVDGEVVGIGRLAGTAYSWNPDVSGDGAVIVGESNTLPPQINSGFRWSAGGMAKLATWNNGFPDPTSNEYQENDHQIATAVSADGTVVAGWGDRSGLLRWVNGVPDQISDSGPERALFPHALSADGSVMLATDQRYVYFGRQGTAPSTKLYRIVGTTGTLLPLPAGATRGDLYGLSDDGSVAVGWAGNEFYYSDGVPVVWGPSGIEILPLPDGAFGHARDASEDGSVIVGEYYSPIHDDERPAVWRNGVFSDLRDELEDAGVDLSNFELESLVGVSADGKVVAGWGEIIDLDEDRAYWVELPRIIVVNSSQDETDRLLGDEKCDTGRRLTIDGLEVRECTLRAALQEALASGDGKQHLIKFNVVDGSPTITLTSPLNVNSSVVVDATTQPGYQPTADEIGVPVLEVVSSEPILISADDVVIQGLVIQNGIRVTGDRVRIEKTYLGTDLAGFEAMGSGDGIFVEEAANVEIEFNLISGNAGAGVSVTGEGAFNTTIQNNIIGLNRNAEQAPGNQVGVVFVRAPRAATSIVRQNVISGNREVGIGLNRTLGLTIRENWIGLARGASTALPNGSDGIRINVSDLTEVRENIVVSHPEVYAISVDQMTLEDKSTGTDISNNTLGMDEQRVTALGSGRILIRNAVDTTVDGGNFASAIEVVASDDTRVSGNFIGVAGDASSPLDGAVPDTPFGIEVRLSAGADISDNRIGYRSGSGVRVEESTGVEVVQNVVFANGGFGIGAMTSDETQIVGNEIVDNTQQGVLLIRSDNVEVSGNRIGVDEDGAQAFPNGLEGVLVNVSSGVAVRENLIASGREQCAISVSQETPADKSTGTVIVNNTLGMDAQRATALGFGCIQVRNAVRTTVRNNFVGGVIVDASDETSVSDNFIGVAGDGESPLAGDVLETNYGIFVSESDGTVLTGNVVAHRSGSGIEVEASDQVLLRENRIVDNGSEGVIIRSGIGNTISQNEIARNELLGIDLEGDGVTPNDPSDADGGANGRLNTPILALAIQESSDAGGGVTLAGQAGRSANADFYTVEVFSNTACHGSSFGQGEQFVTGIGVASDSDALFFETFTFTPNHRFVSATVSDATGNTSEFSRCLPLVPRDQVTQANVSAGQAGTLLNGQGVTISATGGSGRQGAQADRPTAGSNSASAAQRGIGAGTLFATRYESLPTGTAFVDTPATTPDGASVQPEILARRYWYLADLGLTEAGGASDADFLVEVCVDASSVVPSESVGSVVVVQRMYASGGAWTPLDTYRGGSPTVVCTTGITSLGEFGIGGTEGAFPVASEVDPKGETGDDASPSRLTLSISPNPTAGESMVTVSIPTPGLVHVALYDARGRQVAVPFEGERAVGTHMLPLSTARLAPGVYVVRVKTGAEVATRTLTIVR